MDNNGLVSPCRNRNNSINFPDLTDKSLTPSANIYENPQIHDTLSISSETSAELKDEQRLHQTTQSLLMASSIMIGRGSSNSVAEGSPYSIGNIYASQEPINKTSSAHINTTCNNILPFNINLDDLLRENQALKDKLKDVTTDRDRLLCEVSNLRLEFDMSELKRLPEDSFPQRAIERSGSVQYGIVPQTGLVSSGEASSSLSNEGNGFVYVQQPCLPSATTSNSSAVINYPVSSQQQHLIYQQHPQQFPSCHHQQLIPQAANMSIVGGMHYTQYVNPQHHHHILHGHHHHHGGAVVIAGSNVGTGMGASGVSSSVLQQNLLKKNSIRNNNEILKRSRNQTAYELSQDLLEKQIELLERKYGGLRARNAAITIQRAFRHYMMVKKFASITAMAKAEKRLSRRMIMVASNEEVPTSNASMSSAYGSVTESQLDAIQNAQIHAQSQMQPRVTIMAGPTGGISSGAASSMCLTSTSRTPPTRSLSMRERRQADGSPIPRSQSGVSSIVTGAISANSQNMAIGSTMSSHPHVNLLHATEPQYYNINSNASGHHVLNSQSAQYYAGGYHVMLPHDGSFSSSANSSVNLDSSLNVSWVSTSGTSPHTPYYSASQIYMRPKGTISSVERKKVPPEVPKRTSSITAQQHAQHLAAQQQHQQMLLMRQTPPPPSLLRSNGLCKSADNGSLTSVQSSGSESSVTSTERIATNSDIGSDRSNSPNSWKRGNNLNSSKQFTRILPDSSYSHVHQVATPASTVVTIASGSLSSSITAQIPNDDHAISSHTSAAQYEQHEQQEHQLSASAPAQNFKVSEIIRKRQYRVGLNLFNKKPEKGITYLIRRGFLENTPQGVARFLISRKGLSRQMIGEYLGNLQNPFNMAVLNCFAIELDLSGMQVDVALRKFQTYFRMPGEAQKIERLMEIFSQRYCQCNQDVIARLRSSDTVFVLAFAIIMLNTDLHTPNLKPERRMRMEDFIKNLRGIDDCHDIDKEMLAGIYERVKANEFKPGSDHVTQVMKVQATIVGKKPNLALPHRRLVCYCRLYEIPDINKRERPGVHQREVFLFNDLLVITKIFSKKKSSVTYTFRNSFPLCGMVVSLLDVPNYPFCIQLSQKVDGKILITFNARNEHDRCKFAEDLKESISEMDEMETLRIETELERQKSARNRAASSTENRDSGVADVEVCPCPYQNTQSGDPAQGISTDATQQLKRSALSNSLLDMHEQFGNDKPQRRGSVGSLDSGMSISFQSTTTSSASRDNAAVIAAAANAAAAKIRFGMPNSTSSATVGNNVYAIPAMSNYTHANFIHQQAQVAIVTQQQHQQPSQIAHTTPVMGRIPGRERKSSRSDDNGRSTEV